MNNSRESQGCRFIFRGAAGPDVICNHGPIERRYTKGESVERGLI